MFRTVAGDFGGLVLVRSLHFLVVGSSLSFGVARAEPFSEAVGELIALGVGLNGGIEINALFPTD